MGHQPACGSGGRLGSLGRRDHEAARLIERVGFDGIWMGSGRTSLRALRQGIQRFRDAGGKRAMVGTVAVDLHSASHVLGDDDAFDICCGPEEAALRMQRLAEHGFDDVGLVKMGHTTEDLPEGELVAIRALLPQSP